MKKLLVLATILVFSLSSYAQTMTLKIVDTPKTVKVLNEEGQVVEYQAPDLEDSGALSISSPDSQNESVRATWGVRHRCASPLLGKLAEAVTLKVADQMGEVEVKIATDKTFVYGTCHGTSTQLITIVIDTTLSNTAFSALEAQ